jgi:hypothetical protein
MDSRLRERLEKIADHSNQMFHVEHEFFHLDASEKAMLAILTIQQPGKSHAEKQNLALASDGWRDFVAGHSLKKAEYNRERRRHELLLKAFDAEYLTMKVESPVIKRQL